MSIAKCQGSRSSLAGAVDEDLELPELADGGLDGLPDGFLVGRVHLDERAVAPDRGGGLAPGLRVEVGDHHPCAVVRQGLRRGAPETGRPADHQRHPALKPHGESPGLRADFVRRIIPAPSSRRSGPLGAEPAERGACDGRRRRVQPRAPEALRGRGVRHGPARRAAHGEPRAGRGLGVPRLLLLDRGLQPALHGSRVRGALALRRADRAAPLLLRDRPRGAAEPSDGASERGQLRGSRRPPRLWRQRVDVPRADPDRRRDLRAAQVPAGGGEDHALCRRGGARVRGDRLP